MTARDILKTVLTETRQHMTQFKEYLHRHESTLRSSNNTSRDTTALDILKTVLTKTRQHVTDLKQYFQRHDST
jgi:hypothetical protein